MYGMHMLMPQGLCHEQGCTSISTPPLLTSSVCMHTSTQFPNTHTYLHTECTLCITVRTLEQALPQDLPVSYDASNNSTAVFYNVAAPAAEPCKVCVDVCVCTRARCVNVCVLHTYKYTKHT